MTYILLSDDDRKRFALELVGKEHILVKDSEKVWVVKHKPSSVNEEKRDALGFLLGREFANVAEVKILNQEEHKEIQSLTSKDESSTPENTFLVRVAGSYSTDELPCKTLEQATAIELVYSIWIRRRDTHVDNRVYLDAIPIFFDFQTAFLGEPHLADINTFFSIPPTDYGQAGAWKVKLLKKWLTKLTRGEGHKPIMGGYHYVNNIEEFEKEVKKAIDVIKTKTDKNTWEKMIVDVGFASPDRENISIFLGTNLENLERDVSLMLKQVFSE